ncbi:MAG: hypothetical protein ACKKMR_01770 [Candidatus Nealsonbacteria bacterium]
MSNKKIKKDKKDIKKKVKEATEEKLKRGIQQTKQLQQYLKKIDKIPPLSPKEENKLWKKIKEREGDKKLENKILKANLKLVVSTAKKIIKRPDIRARFTLLELISIGEESLRATIKVHRWHWEERKKKFSFYVTYGIKGDIFRSLMVKERKEYEKNIFSPDEKKELLLYGEKDGKVDLIAKIYHRDKKIIIKAKNLKAGEELLKEINQALQKEKYFSIPWHEEKNGIISYGFLLKKLGDQGFLEVLRAEFREYKSLAPGTEGVLANKKFNRYKIKPNLSRIIYK